jgi:peptidoglycan-N-acetylglucosamine deacetylase
MAPKKQRYQQNSFNSKIRHYINPEFLLLMISAISVFTFLGMAIGMVIVQNQTVQVTVPPPAQPKASSQIAPVPTNKNQTAGSSTLDNIFPDSKVQSSPQKSIQQQVINQPPTPIAKQTAKTASSSLTPSAILPQTENITFDNRSFWLARMPNRAITLTFDDGPNPEYTPQILNKLRQANVKATFFLVGSRVKQHCSVVQQIVAEGHELGNHTYTHPYLTKLSRAQQTQEIADTQEIIYRCVGIKPLWFRAPYGDQNKATLNLINKLGLNSALWSIDTRDWDRTTTNRNIADAVLASSGNDIVIMHDGTEANPKFKHPRSAIDRKQTIAALDLFLQQIQARGIRFVTMSNAFSSPK